jgi:hypothetical protein
MAAFGSTEDARVPRLPSLRASATLPQTFGSGSICMAHRLRLLALLAIVSAIALQLPINRARSAEPASQDAATPVPSRETTSTPDTVIIQARKDREIKRQITEFVSGGVVTYFNDSLERWNQPICPMVAGLPSKPAEFIRARVSQVANDSHAPLGAEHCKPNLVVAITTDPDLLIEKWYKRFPGLFNTCNGLGPVKSFLHSRQPVRVFYNAKFASAGGPSAGDLIFNGVHAPTRSDCFTTTTLGTYLHRGAVQELTSVIIVVDGRQTTMINMGQLADYVAMIGLAEIRVQADMGTAPSILHLFQGSDPQPLGLSPWDEVFLHSLYTTEQSSVLEVPIIENRMFKQIVGR